MTQERKKLEVLKFLVESPFAMSPANTDADIDYNMKKLFPELKTTTGSWGLHKILDKLIDDGHVSYQDREIEESGKKRLQRWYSATYDGEAVIRRIRIKNEEEEALDEFRVQRQIKALNHVNHEQVGAYLFAELLTNLEKLLPYFPKYDAFDISKITINEVRQHEYSVSYYTIGFNNLEVAEFIDFLCEEALAQKRYDISPVGKFIQLTDEGRRLKNAGSVANYRDIKMAESANHDAENIRLGNVERRQRVNETNMVVLTLILAVSAAFAVPYYIMEISSRLHEVLNLVWWVALIVLLFGIIAGLVIGLLIVELKSKRQPK